MDSLDERRLKHAEETIARGRDVFGVDSSKGYYWLCSGHMLKIATELKTGVGTAGETVASFLSEILQRSSQIAPQPAARHNEQLLLALAFGRVSEARELAAMPIATEHDAPFQIALNAGLREALGVPQLAVPAFHPVQSEAAILDDLKAVSSGQPTDLSRTSQAWNSLRAKRFANTMFEHRNLFVEAFRCLQRI